MPGPGNYTLDRKDSSVGAYGPDHCRWADKVTQNNNKTDNIKIIMPLTGAAFDAKKLAKLHNVQVQTIYKRKADSWTDLEMVAGKKSDALRDLYFKLDELLAKHPELIPAPKGKKKTRPIRVQEYQPPKFSDEDWNPTPEEEDHYQETGEMRFDLQDKQHRAEFDAVNQWIKLHNAGLACPAEPPLGKYYRVRLPKDWKIEDYGSREITTPIPQLAPPPKPVVPKDDEDDEAHGFDPADSINPADYGYYEDSDD